jgi:single-strand DNA-binding protein
MIRAAIHGRLGNNPVQREIRSGKPMVTASVAVNVAKQGEEPATEWISLAAFGSAGEILARHEKGDVITAMGTLTGSTLTGRGGAERTSWSLLLEGVPSTRVVANNKRPRENAGRRPHAQGRSPHPASRRPASDSGPPLPDDPVTDLWSGRES